MSAPIARIAAAVAILLAATANAEERLASFPGEAKPLLRYGLFQFTSYPAAWSAAQKTNRPILVFATGPNCPHCVRMIGDSFSSPHIKRLVNDSFETVYVDRLEQPALVTKLKIRRYPTTIIVAPNNQVLDVIEGYVDAKTLNQRLQTSFAAHSASTQTR